jgi:AraC family transcriptional regulator
MNEPLVIGRYVGSAGVASCLSIEALQSTTTEVGDGQRSRADGADKRPGSEPDPAAGRPAVMHWTSETPKSWNTHIGDHRILVALCLSQSLLTLTIDGTEFHDGLIDRGTALVFPTGSRIQACVHTHGDFLHIDVPAYWLTEWVEQGDAAPLTEAPLNLRDPVVVKLTGTLLRTIHGGSSLSSIYAEGITLSILARLLEIILARAAVKPPRAPSVSPLEAWRVKMAVDFIDRRIDQSMTSAELGAAVGLSPMHFAARFRAATGTSPHTFILRRRIEHAQTLLTTTKSTVADIAFSVGFRTQAHFTTVFRRHVDDTPHRWRGKQRATARLESLESA